MTRHQLIPPRAIVAVLLAFVLAMASSSAASADQTPAWSTAGADLSDPGQVFSAADFGLVPNDGRSDSAAINAAISEAASAGGGVVLLPQGEIAVNERINLRSNVILRGQGDATRLLIGTGRTAGIYAGGQAKSNQWKQLSQDLSAGATSVPLPETGLIEIEQDNTPQITTQPKWETSWGVRSEGELAFVTGDGALASPLVSDYTTERSARYRTVTPIENAGLEDFSITRADTGSGYSIQFRYGFNVWVRNVTSTDAGQAHVALRQSSNCTVANSSFTGALRNGDGGEGYGISIGRHTTGCEIRGNELSGLRHAIIIQLGASGNVIADNSARGSAGYADLRPRADISLHGHWPQRNLFEGNIVDRIEIGDWWGPAGPGNTFVDNCVMDHLFILDHSNDQVFEGNYLAEIVEDDTVERSSFSGTLETVPEHCS